jgi:quercetin dioxygenase-like cupin family protein
MNDFPPFMKNKPNLVPSSEQNTQDIEGYYFQGADGSQVAYWTCHADRVSRKHTHPFDEYMICVSGQYIAYVEGERHVLNPGDELHIPAGAEQWGEAKAGTRSIHVFGGPRIKAR